MTCLYYCNTHDGKRCILMSPEKWRNYREILEQYCRSNFRRVPTLQEAEAFIELLIRDILEHKFTYAQQLNVRKRDCKYKITVVDIAKKLRIPVQLMRYFTSYFLKDYFQIVDRREASGYRRRTVYVFTWYTGYPATENLFNPSGVTVTPGGNPHGDRPRKIRS